MQIRLITIGDKLRNWVNEGFADYAKRLPNNWDFKLIELPLGVRSKSTPIAKAMKAEGEHILKHISNQDIVIALSPTGKSWNNSQLADKFNDWQQSGQGVALMIGGPDGLSEECLKRANFKWSLSDLVFPHGLARLVVVEQIYRSYSILSGHPYHR